MRQLHPLVRAVLFRPVRLLLLLLLLLLAGAAVALPTITGLSPVRNTRTAARNANVAVTFSQNMGATSGSALRVFSAQAGGRKAAPPCYGGGQHRCLQPKHQL